MSKISRETLTDAVQEELVTYLRNGTINEQSVVRSLDITGLNIANLNRLKRIHFCLSDEVVEFISGLQQRLRRIKTANQREREITRGEVRGSIDWQATTRRRYSEAAGDRTQFACKTPYTEYDIPENLVLKKLVWLVHSTVQSDIKAIEYDWRTDAWPDDRIATFDRLYSRNVHLDRIQDGDEISVTGRMLNAARSARQDLYTDAYTQYDRYQRLLEGKYTDPDISQLLAATLVVPERLPRLFELYCVFRLLRSLDTDALALQPIEPGATQLATLTSDRRQVDVYHDQTGGLSFHVPLSEIDDTESEYLQRYKHAQQRHEKLLDAFLGSDTQQSLFSGRPDLIVEVYEPPEANLPSAVVLGEIKYSDSTQTFAKGLEELVEYLEFAQKGSYLADEEIPLYGLLITDGVETDVATPSDETVTHLTAEQLAETTQLSEWIPAELR